MTKRRWNGTSLMRGEQEVARLVPHGDIWWRVEYRGATSQPATRSDAARLAELATRHD